MKFDIKTNFPDVQRALIQLRTDVASKATASALNRTVAQAKTAMSREIRAEFNLSAGKVNESLRITRAMASGVSHAMICTMTGLAVSISGLYPVYYFRSRTRRETELVADKLVY